jgi:hypothetical protein
MNEELKKRLKSLAWRTAMMVSALLTAFLADNIGLFGFSPTATVLFGLVLGEVSKFLNSQPTQV